MERKAIDHESPPSSSMDSCSGEPPAPAPSTASSGCQLPAAWRRCSSTDLHLALTLSSSCSTVVHADSTPSTPRSALTTAATTTADQGGGVAGAGAGDGHGRPRSLFVKVYMEGVPIGRKLDLLQLDGYSGLLAHLAGMFKASITHPDAVGRRCHQQLAGGERKKTKAHVLTYEDQDGDWMMVGDVPWEMFLASVKRLRIAIADNTYCYVR